jgi:hypothetical protein
MMFIDGVILIMTSFNKVTRFFGFLCSIFLDTLYKNFLPCSY